METPPHPQGATDADRPYTIIVPSCAPHMARRALDALPEALFFDGTGYPSYAKLINDCVVKCPTETIVIVADKIAPPRELVKKAVALLDGYAIVVMKHFYFYAFTKELFRRIGFFDERFLGGGWEEYDLLMRADEAGLPVYRTEEAKDSFIPGPTRWRYNDPSWRAKLDAHMDTKWINWRQEVKRFEAFVCSPQARVQPYPRLPPGCQLPRRNAADFRETTYDVGPSPAKMPSWASAALAPAHGGDTRA